VKQGAHSNRLPRGQFVLLAGIGWSMAPFLKDGDRLVIAPVPVDRLRIGDIIAYDDTSSGAIVCHRVVKKRTIPGGIQLYARGDANWGTSGPLQEHQLRGKVVAVYRGRRVMILTSPWRAWVHYGIVCGHPMICWARTIKRMITHHAARMLMPEERAI